MKSEYLVETDFEVDGFPFRFFVTKDHEIIFVSLTYRRDKFGSELPLDSYQAVDPIIGAKVYRKVFQMATEAIFSYKMKTFWFSTGGETRRDSLYRRLSKRIAQKYNYYCLDLNGTFRFYKMS